MRHQFNDPARLILDGRIEDPIQETTTSDGEATAEEVPRAFSGFLRCVKV
jgi:hypothetical protein